MRSRYKPKLKIFKVQVSVFTSESATQVLVYNESRSIQAQFNASQDILDAMDGEPKKFFYGYVKDNQVHIEGEAPWQDW